MDPVGDEPTRDRSDSGSRTSESNSVDATRQTERVSDVTPQSNSESRSDSAPSDMLVQFRAMTGNLSRNIWRQATDLTSPDWPPRWLRLLAILCILWSTALIIWLVLVIIIPTFIKILVALGLGTSVLISETKWARVVLEPVHGYLNTHSAGFPFSPGELFGFWIAFGVVLFFLSQRGGRRTYRVATIWNRNLRRGMG